MNAIEVKSLFYAYEYDKDNNPKYILNDLSFEIKQGEYVTFIGHNGSGKSTLMKLLVGLLEANKGHIFINDEELDVNGKNIDSIRKNIGIVFQNPDNQFIGSTVKDDIAFGLENNCIKHEDMDPIILEYAKKVGMDEYLDREPSNLSGGQKQRVAIAGALCMKPNILLLDEATAMLDPKGRKEIVDLTHKMRKDNNNMTIVSVTHHMEEAFLSDRIIVLNDGKVYFQGTPKEIFQKRDLLKNVGLDLPFDLKLKEQLINNGFDIEIDDDIKEVGRKLCR